MFLSGSWYRGRLLLDGAAVAALLPLIATDGRAFMAARCARAYQWHFKMIPRGRLCFVAGSFVRHLFIYYYYYYFHSTVVERVIHRTFSIHPQKQNFNNMYHVPPNNNTPHWVSCGCLWHCIVLGHNAPKTDPTQPLSVSSSIPYHSGNRSCDEDDDAVEGKEENGHYEA